MKRYMMLASVVGISAILAGCSTKDRFSAVSVHSGKCLSLKIAGGYYDGDPIEQWNCSHTHMYLQKEWLFVPLPGGVSNYQVKSIHSGKCLEVKLSSTSGKNNGDIIQQSKCTGANNQAWNIVTTSAGTTFKSLYSGKCLQVRLGSTNGLKDGDIIEQWTCTGGTKKQIWKLQAATANTPNPPLDTGTGELCNLCSPYKPNCKSGALCITMLSGQSICGKHCSPSKGCPSGYLCTQIKKLGNTYYQCIPNNYSCPL